MDAASDLNAADTSFQEPNGPARRRLRVCLAASGGGHVRQLLDLEPVWSEHEYFFVTEDTSLGESLRADHTTFFIPHVAAGQARLGHPLRMIGAAGKNLVQSAKIVLRERPDVVISTGAGAVFFTVLLARLIGARVVIIESFARFDRPSLFGRLAMPLAHYQVAQSPALSKFYPRAEIFDPLRVVEAPPREVRSLLFATVGATLPFDRLVRSVEAVAAQGLFKGEVIVQTGVGGRIPEGVEAVETLPFDQVQTTLKRAEIVVCHGGTGSLVTALREGCHVIAMPRLAELGEHYDNHQAEITSAFEARGLITVANTPEELATAIESAQTKSPLYATTDHTNLVSRLKSLLETIGARRVQPQLGATG